MSVRFDAASDRIGYDGTFFAVGSGFTATAWVWASVDTNDFATFARLHNSSGGSTVVTWAASSDGLGGPNYFTGGGSVTNATNLAVGEWRKVAISCSGTTGKTYVNTVGGSTEVDSGTVSVGTPTGITVGGRSSSDSTEYFNGRIAYLRVWSAELSQAQIEAEWASTTPVVTSGLFADWPLTAHTDLTDHSGNGRNLTAGSTSTTTEADPPLTTNTNASAGLASGTGAAGSATASVSAAAGQASGTGAAGTATAAVSRAAGLASGTGAAGTPAAALSFAAGQATGTGAAGNPTPSVSAAAGSASGTGAAAAPSLTAASTASAGHAAGTGAAGSPAAKVAAAAGNAAGTGAAGAPSITADGSTTAAAGHASGTGSAGAPTTAIAASAGAGTGTGAADAPTPKVSPAAGAAAGTGTAHAPVPSVAATAGHATGTGAAGAPTANTGGSTVTAAAGHAAGTGRAYAPTVVTQSAQTGSWYGLLDIYAEAAQIRAEDRDRPPVACPNDGEPLVVGADGDLFCRFDGWKENAAFV